MLTRNRLKSSGKKQDNQFLELNMSGKKSSIQSNKKSQSKSSKKVPPPTLQVPVENNEDQQITSIEQHKINKKSAQKSVQKPSPSPQKAEGKQDPKSQQLKQEEVKSTEKFNEIKPSPSKNNEQNKMEIQPNTQSINKSPSVKIRPEFFVQKRTGSYFENYEKFTEADILGEGAYGRVFRVKNKSNKQEFAMKIIKKANLIQEQKEQFLKEIDVLRQLDNPNIVKLYEFYEDENSFYIVTELVHGKELFDEIIERDSFTEKEVATIMQQILSGLNYAHLHNLVHRDIKPENILIEKDSKDISDWHIKIIDWGVSVHFEKNELLNQKVGTIEYAAPEVFKKKYNEKCDIWSLGVILYIMLGQAPPFQGTNSRESMEKVLVGKYDLSAPIWGKVSNEAKDLVKKMMSYKPEERATAQECLDHPWIKSTSQKIELSQNTLQMNLEKLKDFRASAKLQEAAISFIASHLTTSDERKQLMKTFLSLDKNGDGLLSKQEISDGYEKIMGKDQAKIYVEQIFERTDTDQSGFIDYNEFLTACMDKKDKFSTQKLQQAFKLFDRDGDGFITSEEICKTLGGKIDQNDKQSWEEIVKEVDENGDGQVSFEEFEKIMKKMISQ